MPKVTIVGAGNVGATAAQLILIRQLADVVMVDIDGDMAAGKALDMMHMCSVVNSGMSVVGTSDYAATAGSDVVVITAGLPRRPGMNREDLFVTNSGIMVSVLRRVAPLSPDAVYICVSNPLNALTYLACKRSGIETRRVIGMGGRLDCARLKFAICQKLGCHPSRVEAWVIGNHGQGMLCLPRLSTVDGKALSSVMDAADIEEVCRRATDSGIEVINLLKTGSAFYGPATGILHMVEAVVRDLHVETTACTYLTGEYGVQDMCMNVPVILGARGVEEIIELDLNEEELSHLQKTAEQVRSKLALLDL